MNVSLSSSLAFVIRCHIVAGAGVDPQASWGRVLNIYKCLIANFCASWVWWYTASTTQTVSTMAPAGAWLWVILPVYSAFFARV